MSEQRKQVLVEDGGHADETVVVDINPNINPESSPSAEAEAQEPDGAEHEKTDEFTVYEGDEFVDRTTGRRYRVGKEYDKEGERLVDVELSYFKPGENGKSVRVRERWTPHPEQLQTEIISNEQLDLDVKGIGRLLARYDTDSYRDALAQARKARETLGDDLSKLEQDDVEVVQELDQDIAVLQEQINREIKENPSPFDDKKETASAKDHPSDKSNGNEKNTREEEPEFESYRDEQARLRDRKSKIEPHSPEAWQIKRRLQELNVLIENEIKTMPSPFDGEGGKPENRPEDGESQEDTINRLLEENYPGFSDLSDEEKQKLESLVGAVIVAVKATYEQPQTQETDEAKQQRLERENEEKQRQEEEKKRQAEEERRAKITELRQEVDEAHAGSLKDAMDVYAARQADYESKWSPRGRSKREALLKEAEAALAQAKIAQAKALIEKLREAGLYDGYETDRERGQQVSDDMFDEMRTLDAAKRQRTNEIMQQRIENRNVFQKFGASIGRFLNKRGKLAKFGAGAGLGAVTGFLTAAGGVSGLNLLFGAGAGVAAYGTSRAASVENILATHRNAEGGAKETLQLSEQQIAEMGDRWKDGSVDLDAIGRSYTSQLFTASRERARADRKEAHKKALGNAMAVGGGFMAGTGAGTLAEKLVSGNLDFPNPINGRDAQASGELIGNGDSAGADGSGASTNIDPIEENALDGGRDSSGYGLDSVENNLDNGASQQAESFADYNSNGAPEHLFQELTGTEGVASEQLFHDLAKEIGGYDNLFVNSDGSPVDLKDFGGSIDIGYAEWNQNNSAGLSDVARAALARRGYTV